ncbi:hypothetical protein C0Q70_13740 [Pomacea canaliculata]|uniref:Hemicentin-1-like von Willebrand factor A domain-containing protein n=1 Tax=Pomacea canaliculata TaxID=400727 RepID=A0A2T7NY29_POMCA|nr:hypothetical protein C0Q70_13740 [Pomacea canaliculata]
MADTPVQPPLAKHDSKMLDLAFAMDTTGSMGSYIDAARDNVRRITEEIVAKETCDVRLALVNYRDHPPQEMTYVTQVHDFTPKIGEMKRWLDDTSASGGGDAPEAVADALHQPSGDTFPNGCPDGLDPMMTVRQMAEKAITLYVAGCEPSITPYKDFFAALAYVTGGQYVPLNAARALTSVIVGGAQEELSLEQWMDQVNEMVMAEVREQGEANVDMDSLTARVKHKLNTHGARSRQLKVNNSLLPAASDSVRSLSSCVHMEEVRKEWRPEPAPAASASSRSMFKKASASRPKSGTCESMAAPSPSRGGTRVLMATPSSSRGGTSESMVESLSLDCEKETLSGAPSYETAEDEISMGQAQRMLQKALMRNKISIPKK